MLAAELRHLGLYLWIVVALFASVFFGAVFAKAEHWSIYVATGLACLALCAFGFASLVVWLRNVRAGHATEKARYAPIVVNVAMALLTVYGITMGVSKLKTSGWKHGIDSLAITCIAAAWFAWTLYRSRSARERAPVPASTQRVVEQLRAAYALPAGPDRARALRPVRVRGFVRLGLIAAEIPLMLSLAPHLGILAAFLVSFGIVAGMFLTLHRAFDM